jgi:molybdate transport system substrate-binding protein
VILFLAAAGTALPARSAEVIVFAAASLTESLKEIAATYEQQSGDRVVFNLAASGPLARQIEEGAPADVFISADEARMDALEQQDLIVKETRRSRLSNLLVIVTSPDNPLALASPTDLAQPAVKRVALGEVRTVPVGAYAREYLTRLELWTAIEGKVIPCESVRAVLAAVESGNVDAGIVYRTDAAVSRKVTVVFEVPRDAGPAISYPMALVTHARQPVAARKFLDHLGGDAAAVVFTRHQFLLLPGGPKR